MKEIDILRRANSKGCLILDKESRIPFGEEDLLGAQRDGLYQDEDKLSAPAKHAELIVLFQGCMQLGGDSKRFAYQMVGQTKHFALFYAAPREPRRLA